jgi:hypothetical protein
MKNVVARFEVPLDDGLAAFAYDAVTKGNDARWRKLMGAEAGKALRREPTATPRVVSPAALMLRLRLGFGVGIKADVIAALIGAAGASMTVQSIASATRYYTRAVRRAAEELHSAGFIGTRATAPLSYSLDLEKWGPVLQFDPNDPPAWRSWVAIYSFVTALSSWSDRISDVSDVVVASEARDLISRHSVALDEAGVKEMPASRYPGAAFLEPFTEMLEGYADFVRSIV